MLKDLMNFYEDIQQGYLNIDDVIFLQNISSKQEEINEEIKKIEIKKDSITNKINENLKTLTNNTKEYREYVDNAEFIIESLKAVLRNLNELIDEFKIVENNLEKLFEKYDNGFSLIDLKDQIDELKHSIDYLNLLDEKIKKDNEKNYIIIDGFDNEPIITNNTNLEVDNDINFYNLNEENLQDNPVLRICEKRVELPYTKKEIKEYMRKYPDEYKTVQDVIINEFMMHIDVFKKHPILARFREAYYLCRTKEMMSIFDSFIYAKDLMFRSEINPYIIAAVKSKKQLEDYIKCLENNTLEEYSHFKIIFDINPHKI